MVLSRASFACMIKVMGLGDDFMAMVDAVEMAAGMQDGGPDEIQNELLKELKSCQNYDQIYARWEASSWMRTWFIDKKKSWANKVKEEEEKKKKEEEKKEEKKDEKKDDKKEEGKKDEGKKEEEKMKEEAPKEEIKEEKKEVIEEETIVTSEKKGKTKDEIELSKIIEKIVEKAEFIIKLSMPK